MKNELRTARIEFSIFHFPFVSLIVVEAGSLCAGIVSLNELNTDCNYFTNLFRTPIVPTGIICQM